MTKPLQYYLDNWHLSDPSPLAQTRSSNVYLATLGDERVVLKILNDTGDTEERYGAATLDYFNGEGAIRLLNHDADASLIEYVEGPSLTDIVKSGDDEKATAIIGEVLNSLHRSRPDSQPPELFPLRERFASLFAKAKQDREASIDSIYVRAANITEYLLSNPKDQCVLHGDIHHDNIRYSAQRGWLAYDPQGIFGERAYDAANTLRNPLDMTELSEDEPRLLKNADILADVMGIDRTRLLAFVFAHACLSASWFLGDGVEPLHDLAIAAIVEPHIKHLQKPPAKVITPNKKRGP